MGGYFGQYLVRYMSEIGKDVFRWANIATDFYTWVWEKQEERGGRVGVLFKSLQGNMEIGDRRLLENEYLKQKMKKGLLDEGERTSAQVDIFSYWEIFSLRGEDNFIDFLAFDMDHPFKFYQFMHCHWPEGEGKEKQELFVDIYFKLLDYLEEWNDWDKEERFFWEQLVMSFAARLLD